MTRDTLDYIKILLSVLLVLVCTSFCAVRLMKIQVVDSQNYQKDVSTQSSYLQKIPATRGEIIDAADHVIVGNHVTYAVMIDEANFPSDYQKSNAILLRLLQILSDAEVEWADTLPVSMNAPYRFRMDASEDELSRMKEMIHVNAYATAENCMDVLFEKFEISEDYTPRQRRMIAGLRYAMLQYDFSLSNQFQVAEELSMDVVTELSQLSMQLQGIVISQIPERRIEIGDVIPHEIGMTGPIYAENAEEYKEKGYSMDAIVGISGIEKAMEEELQGKEGTRKMTFEKGELISDEMTEPVICGNTVKLTINSEFQRGLQEILENFLEDFEGYNMKKDEDGNKINNGALVVLDAKTGAVLGEATAPSYDLKFYSENYEELLNDAGQPLFNRATMGLYRPGSTFKTITATAGLNEGLVTGDTAFFCSQTYQYYDVPFSCTGYHRNIAVARALMVSCNSYFYELARMLNIDKIAEYANYYGIGQNTGIETRDSAGYMATPAKYQELGIEWTAGQVLQAGIGNGETMVTPLQLACVANTIANEGVRYEPYLIDSIWDYSQKKCMKKTKPTVASRIAVDSDSVYETIEHGMILASGNGFPAKYSLKNLGYDVAIKTGTPQSDSHYQDSVFIGYAPADDPEIAFAGVVEGGEYSKYMIRSILELYEKIYKDDPDATETTEETTEAKSTRSKRN
ncbi:MAG: hypothetical protein K2O42_07670 [Oscillospiraceae bacterium]|nr:hypothetical protein [Oscillospiraceae bacterium]